MSTIITYLFNSRPNAVECYSEPNRDPMYPQIRHRMPHIAYYICLLLRHHSDRNLFGVLFIKQTKEGERAPIYYCNRIRTADDIYQGRPVSMLRVR
jgi:hypothetical protein